MGKPGRRGGAVCIGAVLLLWAAVWIPRLHGPIDLRWDASTYFVLGTSLAEGRGYRLLNEPGAIEAVQYPPLLPALVALHERALGTADYVIVGSRLRLCYFVLSGAYLLAAYFVVRSFLRAPLALVATAGTGLSFYAFLYPSDALYAEIPFALVTMLFLLCLRRRDRPAYGVAAGVLGATAYLLRTAGVALLAVWVLDSLVRRRLGQAAVRAAMALLPVLAWQAHVARVSGSAGAGALIGACLLIRRREWLLPLFYGVSIAMITLTPWQSQFWRYLAPLAPLSFLFAIVALEAASERLARHARWGQAAGAFAVTVPLAVLLLVQAAAAAGYL